MYVLFVANWDRFYFNLCLQWAAITDVNKIHIVETFVGFSTLVHGFMCNKTIIHHEDYFLILKQFFIEILCFFFTEFYRTQNQQLLVILELVLSNQYILVYFYNILD